MQLVADNGGDECLTVLLQKLCARSGKTWTCGVSKHLQSDVKMISSSSRLVINRPRLSPRSPCITLGRTSKNWIVRHESEMIIYLQQEALFTCPKSCHR